MRSQFNKINPFAYCRFATLSLAAACLTLIGLACAARADSTTPPQTQNTRALYSIDRALYIPDIVDDVTVGINDSDVVAYWHLAQGSTIQAYTWQNDVRQPLGALPGDRNSISHAINNNGDVVGWSVSGKFLTYTPGFSKKRAFLYRNGGMQSIGTLGGDNSAALGINNSGVVVGWSEVDTKTKHAFAYQDGKMTDLGSLNNSTFSAASAVNDSGLIVGASLVTETDMHAVEWTNFAVTAAGNASKGPNGSSFDYGLLFNRTFTHADLDLAKRSGLDSREVGLIAEIAMEAGVSFRDVDQLVQVGTTFPEIADRYHLSLDDSVARKGETVVDSYEAAYAHTGRYAMSSATPAPLRIGIVDLGTLGGKLSRATAVNNLGHIAGFSDTTASWVHGFLYKDGQMIDLGGIGDGPVHADGMNDHDQIVGRASASLAVQHAFIWQNGRMDDLNNLIPAGSKWTLIEAYSINNHGTILCKATKTDSAPGALPNEYVLILRPVASAQ